MLYILVLNLMNLTYMHKAQQNIYKLKVTCPS